MTGINARPGIGDDICCIVMMATLSRRGTPILICHAGWWLLACVIAAMAACGQEVDSPEVSSMKITSDAFAQNGRIPAEYTCDGRDVSPPLSFDGVPSDARSIALIVDDPDAPRGTWDHWVVWNIPPATRTIAAGESPDGVVGRNSWNRNAWGGPCPPSGEHRYVFKVFALDKTLALRIDAGTRELERAMNGHVLAQAELVGKYERAARR